MIVIHSTPRTGGFSMRSVLSDRLGIRTIHAHYLANRYYYADKRSAVKKIDTYGREKWKVIAIVRDPIARNLSEYWRRWFVDRPGYEEASPMREEIGLRTRPGSHEEKFFAFIDHFRQHYFFGSELEQFWGIDVMAEPFLPPYRIYDDRLLVIRTEDLTWSGIPALEALLETDLEDRLFPTKNIIPLGRDPIALTEAYVEAMFQDKYFPAHFWHEDDIERMKEKWMTLTPPP